MGETENALSVRARHVFKLGGDCKLVLRVRAGYDKAIGFEQLLGVLDSHVFVADVLRLAKDAKNRVLRDAVCVS